MLHLPDCAPSYCRAMHGLSSCWCMLVRFCNSYEISPLSFFKRPSTTMAWFCCCINLCIGEGNGTPLQYSCLENPMDGGAWWAAVHGVAKSQTRLSDFTFTFHFHALEKAMAPHSTVLAWRIPGTGKPGGLLSMGSHRVGHDWSDLAAAAAASLCMGLGTRKEGGGKILRKFMSC